MKSVPAGFYAYLAGFIDGDGSIFMSSNNGPGKSGISVRVCAFQKEPEILRRFQKLTGYGIIRCRERVPRRTPFSSISPSGLMFVWEVHKADEVRDLLEQLNPYLFLKKKPAKIVLRGTKLIRGQGQRPSQEDKKRRRKVWRDWEEYRNGRS